MAGVKGMKGGGGARPNTGFKPAGAEPRPDIAGDDEEVFLRALVADGEAPLRLRLDAAKALYAKSGDTGKKGQKEKAAKEVARGNRFSAPTQPKLDTRRLN